MSDRWDHLTEQVTFRPIGFVRSAQRRKFDVPHQPDHNTRDTVTIELNSNAGLEPAVEDLSGFDYVWLVSWFHRNSTWKPKVRPPRGDEKKRGLFATRSPHRPNPIGITAVRLLRVEGLRLTVASCDLVDGTPILDIKPYIPGADSFPNAAIGWLADIEQDAGREPQYRIEYSDMCRAQAEWLRAEGMNFLERAEQLLSRDPAPHRTRRIRPYGRGIFRMGCGEWRVFFSVQGESVRLEYIHPGYPRSYLEAPGEKTVPNREVQLRYLERWDFLPREVGEVPDNAE